jgi:outer membrane protein TolC
MLVVIAGGSGCSRFAGTVVHQPAGPTSALYALPDAAAVADEGGLSAPVARPVSATRVAEPVSGRARLPTPPSLSVESPPAEPILAGLPEGPLPLELVIASVYHAYPLLDAAVASREIAFGDHLSAHGAYDVKLKGATENGPLGFYESYRHRFGFERATYGGGSIFGGYRIGRGEFPPWYLERQTNEGGEFTGGVALPLARNITIDERRAQLWRTQLDQQQAEPEIRLQRVDFVRAASYAYWDWVAAGRRYQIATSLLQLAQGRDEAIRRKVETGDSEPPVLQDNRRLIVSREAKVIEAERKLNQAAIKLSLFLRDGRGDPLVPGRDRLPEFPVAEAPNVERREQDVQAALANRPELQALQLLRRQYEIDLDAARNELLPDLQAVVSASQDVGFPVSARNDKSELELEAGLYLDVPLERRQARGKLTAVTGKLRQVSAKARMAEDKIVADVNLVYAALVAAHGQIERARESVELAEKLAVVEQRKFELGESDLLSVNLREQQFAEAQGTLVDALVEFFTASADYQAALGRG